MNKAGFTLLEVIISLFILTIIGVMISTGLNMIMRTQEHIITNYKTLTELQLANMIMEQDIQQIINQPALDETGMLIPALTISRTEIEFTRSGYINFNAVNRRSTLQRVAYKLEGDALVRLSWSYLDKAPGTQVRRQILIRPIEALSFMLVSSSNKISTPQQGIQIEMILPELGDMMRLIPIAVTNITFLASTQHA